MDKLKISLKMVKTDQILVKICCQNLVAMETRALPHPTPLAIYTDPWLNRFKMNGGH